MAAENSLSGDGVGGDSSKAPSSFVRKCDRLMFTVELRQGETTIVSWKKLMKDADKANNGSASAPENLPNVNPALESRIAPEKPVHIEEKDASQPHRFSAVIQKIESLYMGKDSSDEEDLLDVPDDQYDTEDSFIDDAELDEYFEVDNSAIKHDGFFINRGKLERINEPPVLDDHYQQPKKRRRKDVLKNPGENIDGDGSNKRVKVGKKAAGKNAPLLVKRTVNSSQNSVVPTKHSEDLKSRNQLDVSRISSKKKTVDARLALDASVGLKVSNDDVASVAEAKDADKMKRVLQVRTKNTGDKCKDTSGLLEASHQKYHEKRVYAHSKSQSGRPSCNLDNLQNTGRSKQKNGTRELPDLNLSGGKSAIRTPIAEHTHTKDGPGARPRVSMLEKAIHELEKTVAESRPPAVENQEADSTSQAVKRRLPREIKLKLAKVARLAQASQGKVSKELINRLMSILGHLIQLRTLKRNLNVMISMGLSAKQEKDDRFQQIKKEVVELIKMQAPSLESKQPQQAGSSGDQELGPDGKPIVKKFSMDTALEDRICDLYDLFVDGLDENSGPQIRKLYAELAELWPNGYMDNHGIKRAICRAKERRRTLHNRHKEDQERIKRRKLLAPKQEESVQVDVNIIGSQQIMRARLPVESSSHAFVSVNKEAKEASNTVTAVRVPSPMNGPKLEKVKGNSSSSHDDAKVVDGVLIKKKVKRKAEPELDGTQFRPGKRVFFHGEEKTRPLKQSTGLSPKSNLQPASLPGLEQSS